MRTTPSKAAEARRARRALTLTEMMISMGIFTVVIGAVIAAHIMGLRLNEWTIRKLGADDMARRTFSSLQAEVRSATTLKIGNGTATNFVQVADGSAQQGMALQIYRTTATNIWSRYYFDTNSSELRRVQSSATTPITIARYLTNSIIFKAENFQGTVLTETANNRVINITLQFYQLQYPFTKIGPSNAFDYYQLQAKIARRIL
ncbi:MAG: hypothetical protein FJ386_02655 [Verrucomicrobia bacterium]|nr:hypothetical protein [Verrucomicrobiota bacterium]